MITLETIRNLFKEYAGSHTTLEVATPIRVKLSPHKYPIEINSISLVSNGKVHLGLKDSTVLELNEKMEEAMASICQRLRLLINMKNHGNGKQT